MPRLVILLSSVISLLATSLLLEISCDASVEQQEYLDTPIKNFNRNDKPSWKGESLTQSRLRARPRPKHPWAKEASPNDAVGLLANSRYSTVLQHKRCICGGACEELNKFSHGCPKSCNCHQHSRIAGLHFNQKVRSIDFPTSNEIASADKGHASKFALQELQSNGERITNEASTSQIAELDPDETQETFSNRLAEIEERADDLLVKFTQLEDAVLRNNTDQDFLRNPKKRRASRAHLRKLHGGQYARLRGFPQHFYALKRSGSPYTGNISHKGNVGSKPIIENSLGVTRAEIYEPKNTAVHEIPTKTLGDVYANKYVQRGLNLREVPEFKNRLPKINHRYNTLIKERSQPLISNDNYKPKRSLLGNYLPFKTKADKLGSLSNYQMKGSVNYKGYSRQSNYNKRSFFKAAAMEATLPKKQKMEYNLPEEPSPNIELNRHDYQETPTATNIRQNSEKLPSTFLAANFVPQIANKSEVDIDDEEVVDNHFPIHDGDYSLSKPKRHARELRDIQCNDQEQNSQLDETPPSTFLLQYYVPLLSDLLGSTTEENKLEVKCGDDNLLETKSTDTQEDDEELIPPHTFLLENYIPMILPEFLQDEECSSNLTGGDEQVNNVLSSLIQNQSDVANVTNYAAFPDLVPDINLPTYGSLNMSQPCFKDDLPVQSCQFDSTSITYTEPSVSTDFHIVRSIHEDITEMYGDNGYNEDVKAQHDSLNVRQPCFKDDLPVQSCQFDNTFITYTEPSVSTDFHIEGNIHGNNGYNGDVKPQHGSLNVSQPCSKDDLPVQSCQLNNTSITDNGPSGYSDFHTHGDIVELNGDNDYDRDVKSEPLRFESCVNQNYRNVEYDVPNISLQDHHTEKNSNSDNQFGKESSSPSKTPVFKPTSWAQVYLPQDYTVHVSDDNSDGSCIPSGSVYNISNNDNLKRHIHSTKEGSYPLFGKANLLGRVHGFKKNAFKSRLNALSKTQQLQDKVLIPKSINDMHILTTTRNVHNTLGPQESSIESYPRRKTLHRRNLPRVPKHKSVLVNPHIRNSLLAQDYADISRKSTSGPKNMLKRSYHIPPKYSLYQANLPKIIEHDYLSERNLHGLNLIKTARYERSHLFKGKLPITEDNTNNLCGENLQVVHFANINTRQVNEFPLHENSTPKTVKRVRNSIGPQLKKFYKLIADHFIKDHKSHGNTRLHKGPFYCVPGHHIIERFPITEDEYEVSRIKDSKHTCDEANLHQKCSDTIKWGNVTASNQVGANKQILDRLLEVKLPYLKEYETNCHEGNSCEVHKVGEHKIVKRLLTPKDILHRSSLFHDEERSRIIQEHKGIRIKNCKQIIDQLFKENLPYLKQHGLDLDSVTLNIVKDHKPAKRHIPANVSWEINDQNLDLHKNHSHIILEHKDILYKPTSHSIKNSKQILDQLLKDNVAYLEHHGLNAHPAKLNKINDHKLDERHLPSNDSYEISEHKLSKNHLHEKYLHIIEECKAISRRSRPVKDCKRILAQLLKDNLPYVKKFELYSTKVRLDRSSPYKIIEHELTEWQALNENVPTSRTYDSAQHSHEDYISSGVGNDNNLNEENSLEMCENDAISYNGPMDNMDMPKATDLGWKEIPDEYTAKVDRDSKLASLKGNFSLGKHNPSDLCKVFNESNVNVSNIGECPNAVYGTSSSKDHAYLSEDNSYYEVNDAGEREVYSQNSDVGESENDAAQLSVLKNEVDEVLNEAKIALNEDAMPAQHNTEHDLQKDGQERDNDKKTSRGVRLANGHDSRWMWTPWSAWSPCSVTCGKGRVTRHRKCLVEQCKDKTEEELHEKTCQMPACGLKGFFGLFN